MGVGEWLCVHMSGARDKTRDICGTQLGVDRFQAGPLTKHLKKRGWSADADRGTGIRDRRLFLVVFVVMRAACGEVIFDHLYNAGSRAGCEW